MQLWHPTGAPTVAGTGRPSTGPGRPAVAGGATYDPTFERGARLRADDHHDTPGEIATAFAPYIIIVAVSWNTTG